MAANLAIDNDLVPPAGIRARVETASGGSIDVCFWWDEACPIQVGLKNAGTGEWTYCTNELSEYRFTPEHKEYIFKIRRFNIRTNTAGPWSAPLTLKIFEKNQISLEISAGGNLQINPKCIPPGNIRITNDRIEWSGNGPFQAGILDLRSNQWHYKMTTDSFLIPSEIEGRPDRFALKVRSVHTDGLFASRWSDVFHFNQIGGAFIKIDYTLLQFVNHQWKDIAINPPHQPFTHIFIGGAPRTGTTLLQNILCTDRDVNPQVSEAVIFRYLIDCFNKSEKNDELHPAMYFSSNANLKSFFCGIINNLLQNFKSLHNCHKTVLKEPELTKFFPLINRLVDSCCFICIIRDPRDAVVSMLQWGEKMRERGEKHFFQNRDMDALGKYYLSFYLPVFNALKNNESMHCLFIRYEDLVSEPDAQATHLQSFTGLNLNEYSPFEGWKRTAIDYDSLNLPIRDAVTELYGQPVSNARVDAFKKVLNEREIIEIQDACRLIFSAFEYHLL